MANSAAKQTVMIALFGASGNISSQVISCLQRASLDHEKHDVTIQSYTLRIITRTPEPLKDLVFPFKVEVIVGSIDEVDRLDELLQGVTRVFFCLPQHLSAPDMIVISQAFSRSAGSMGVQTVVRISSYGMDEKSATTSSQGSLGQAHILGEQCMRDSGLKCTSVRPTSFFSNFLKYDFPSIQNNGTFCSPLGNNASVNWISCEDIAAVVAAALLNESLDGKILDITGSECNTLSAEGMRAIIESETGKSISYTELPVPDSGDMNGLWTFLRAGGFSHHTNTFEKVCKRKPITFSDFVSSLPW
jgi:uncharacterized protein YbjT (DUF2867 family)